MPDENDYSDYEMPETSRWIIENQVRPRGYDEKQLAWIYDLVQSAWYFECNYWDSDNVAQMFVNTDIVAIVKSTDEESYYHVLSSLQIIPLSTKEAATVEEIAEQALGYDTYVMKTFIAGAGNVAFNTKNAEEIRRYAKIYTAEEIANLSSLFSLYPRAAAVKLAEEIGQSIIAPDYKTIDVARFNMLIEAFKREDIRSGIALKQGKDQKELIDCLEYSLWATGNAEAVAAIAAKSASLGGDLLGSYLFTLRDVAMFAPSALSRTVEELGRYSGNCLKYLSHAISLSTHSPLDGSGDLPKSQRTVNVQETIDQSLEQDEIGLLDLWKAKKQLLLKYPLPNGVHLN
jgi:hypothetical protein